MTINHILSALDGLKETGPGKYVARCPGHDDRSPSLAIRERDDGVVLLHCFAGCEIQSVLETVGLTFTDLYPEKPVSLYSERPARQRFDARQALEGITHEAIVVCLVAEKYADLVNGDDSDRLILACSRINAALNSTSALNVPPELKAVRSAS